MRFAEVDLNEDEEDVPEQEQSVSGSDSDDEEEEEEEGEPDEFIDVLDILDGRGEPENEDDAGEVKKEDALRRKGTKAITSSQQDSDEYEDEHESQNEDEDMVDDARSAGSDNEDSDSEALQDEESDHHISASDVEDDIENPDALANLQTFLTSLDAGQKRKAPTDGTTTEQDAEKRPKKRRFLQEKTEAGAENEFAAHVGALLCGNNIYLYDLLTLVCNYRWRQTSA